MNNHKTLLGLQRQLSLRLNDQIRLNDHTTDPKRRFSAKSETLFAGTLHRVSARRFRKTKGYGEGLWTIIAIIPTKKTTPDNPGLPRSRRTREVSNSMPSFFVAVPNRVTRNAPARSRSSDTEKRRFAESQRLSNRRSRTGVFTRMRSTGRGPTGNRFATATGKLNPSEAKPKPKPKPTALFARTDCGRRASFEHN